MIALSKKFFFSAMVRPLCVVAVLGGLISVSSPATAVIEPVALASDPRVKTIAYGPDQVYKYTGYIRYQTSIEFAEDETISTISMGDQSGWKLNPMGNKMFLKPIDLDVTTNMTLITNKRTYLFEMHAEEARDIDDKRLTFILRFVYPDDTDGGVVTSFVGMDRVPDLESEDLSKYNFRYSITGSEDISPIRIFDDGEFTFFEFRGINADIPAFFQVDNQGKESLINFRTRGNYIVVERVSGQYTLRHGSSVVCVFNEAWGNKPKQKDSSWFGFGGSSSSNGVQEASHKSGTTVK
jgi:type IV secretion system protein VirB9